MTSSFSTGIVGVHLIRLGLFSLFQRGSQAEVEKNHGCDVVTVVSSMF